MSLGPKGLSVLERDITSGSAARAILSAAETSCPTCGHGHTIFTEIERQIIKESVAWVRTHSPVKDDHLAVRFLARLSEIMALQDALKYRVEQGAKAQAKLVNRDQTASE